MIKTKNLQLVIIKRDHIKALLHSKNDLAKILHVSIPADWPTFPEAFSLPDNESQTSEQHQTGWGGYFFIHPEEGALVGNGGFKGEPDDSGSVEIGYEIAPQYWNRGFATEAAKGMIDYAFTHENVKEVLAHTLAEINASNNVLQKIGMKFVTELDDPDVGKIWQWKINRNEYQHIQ